MKPVIRASGLDRLLACPASRELEAKLPLDFSGIVEGDGMTWRGNWCHWKSARRLVDEFGAVAPHGLLPPAIPVGWRPAPWDERAADWFVSNVVVATPEDHALFVEHRIDWEFERFILTGQLDVYSVDGEVAYFIINDQKAGVNEVDHAENNWQLAAYVALLKLKFPTLQRGKARILQKSAAEPITEVEINELDDVARFVEEKINAALDARLVVETGYKQCRLCPCIEFCPAIDLELTAMKLLLTENDLETLQVTSDTKSLAELAARGRAIAGPIDRILKSLKERLILQPQDIFLEDGTKVAIVDTEGHRAVRAPRVAFEIAKDRLGEDAAWETMSMSLAALEDQLVESGLKRKSVKETSATSWVNDRLGHLIQRPKLKTLKFV